MICYRVSSLRNNPVIVLGAGGHAKVCIDLLRCAGREILGWVAPESSTRSVLGAQYLGDDERVFSYNSEDVVLVNGIGYMPRTTLRFDLYRKFKLRNYQFLTLAHPRAIVASDVMLGEGGQVMAGAVIQPSTQVGENSIVNTRASVDHDCVIGAHCHIAPGATLSGGVVIKDHAFIGAGATVIQGVSIAENTIVAAGSTVKEDIKSESVFYE